MSESPPPPSAGRPDGQIAAAERKPRTWLWIALIAALAGAGWYFYDRHQAQTLAEKKEAAAKKGFGKGLGGPTPVVAVPARKGRIDVYLEGLGTVTPLRTVTVRSRVEGELIRVHFEEGELVTHGGRAYAARPTASSGGLSAGCASRRRRTRWPRTRPRAPA